MVERVVLTEEGRSEAVDVLTEAFFDYPVMTYVIGDVGEEYASRLRRLVDYFTMARFYRGDLVLGLRSPDGELLAAANLNRPSPGEAPAALLEHRDRLWPVLGADAQERYASYGRACEPLAPREPHYHLGMIGVRRSSQGAGLGGAMLRWVHEISAADAGSEGVSLTTEVEGNVAFYEYFGYRIVGRGELGNSNPTWTFWRPDP